MPDGNTVAFFTSPTSVAVGSLADAGARPLLYCHPGLTGFLPIAREVRRGLLDPMPTRKAPVKTSGPRAVAA